MLTRLSRPHGGTFKTGTLPESVTERTLTLFLGKPLSGSDDGKSTMEWHLIIDGDPVAIWDYKGARWSVWNPKGIDLTFLL